MSDQYCFTGGEQYLVELRCDAKIGVGWTEFDVGGRVNWPGVFINDGIKRGT